MQGVVAVMGMKWWWSEGEGGAGGSGHGGAVAEERVRGRLCGCMGGL